MEIIPQSSIYTRDYFSNPGYKIGEHTYGRPKVYDWNEKANLIVGRYTSFADDVSILLGGNHRMDWASMYPFPALEDAWPEAAAIDGHPWTKGDVIIGNDVWIGNGATILSGVRIGDGAVVAARALVAKDVAPFSIVGGNPAKEIRKRFDKKRSKMLQEARWWDWPEDFVRANVTTLCSGDIKAVYGLSKQIWHE